MRNKVIIALVVLFVPFMMHAQLKGLANKVKYKTAQRIDQKTDRAIDKALDEVEGKEEVKPAETKTETVAPAKEEPKITSYSKYDFVPGERVIYAEDFTQDDIGELPPGWNTNGKAELVTVEGKDGRWLRIYQNALYLTANKDSFSKNFTIEFDVILGMKPNGWLYPEFSFGFMSTKDQPSIDNAFLRQYKQYASVQANIHLGEGGNTRTNVESYFDRVKSFYSENQNLASLENFYNNVAHVAVQVQDKRLRIWFNAEKKFDIPMAVPTGYPFNQVFFKLSPSNYKDDMLSFYIGNLKVATGKPDTRHKLLDEGKFSTTGILFDIQSASIRPESYGVIREIGLLLKENPSVKIKVVGHTSSDGDDSANMELSKKRAAAVKEALIKEFAIDESRMVAEGKGEMQPVSDNKTKEGKVQNRRVEFIKM